MQSELQSENQFMRHNGNECKALSCCVFILSDRFVLSLNSAPDLRCHANVVGLISENKVKHLLLPHKGIHYSFSLSPPPQRTQKRFCQMVFVAWLHSNKWGSGWCANKNERNFSMQEKKTHLYLQFQHQNHHLLVWNLSNILMKRGRTTLHHIYCIILQFMWLLGLFLLWRVLIWASSVLQENKKPP